MVFNLSLGTTFSQIFSVVSLRLIGWPKSCDFFSPIRVFCFWQQNILFILWNATKIIDYQQLKSVTLNQLILPFLRSHYYTNLFFRKFQYRENFLVHWLARVLTKGNKFVIIKYSWFHWNGSKSSVVEEGCRVLRPIL